MVEPIGIEPDDLHNAIVALPTELRPLSAFL